MREVVVQVQVRHLSRSHHQWPVANYWLEWNCPLTVTYHYNSSAVFFIIYVNKYQKLYSGQEAAALCEWPY